MKRTKRWLLIFAALVCLVIHVGAIRATSLIFGKTSTTTTTTQSPENPSSIEEAETTEPPSTNANETSTKPVLTGIPQIDYIYDPNLPRELNGYNLSDYPFYNSVPPPEEIDFKCDGLHDGFYASVKHKCQLYHHCLFGIRYDFLCANFTAFDQKTFICHFVSEVDCKNSPKYFHRNDALYQAASSSTTTTTTTTAAPPPPTASAALPISELDRPRQNRPHRRPPLRRRRPQVDYYYYDDDYDDDDYYERVNRRRKQRPRGRRPDYEDDYDDRRIYRDDDRYEKRPHNRDRIQDETDEYEYDRRKHERPRNRNRPNDSRRINEDDRRPLSDRRRPMDDRRLGMGDRRYNSDDRRSFNDERRYSMERSKSQEVEDLDDERRPLNGRRRINGDRRPTFDDELDRSHQRDQDEDIYNDRKDHKTEHKLDEKFVRPSGSGSSSSLSSLFERPRLPPKIARPVPLTEKKKYEYTTKKTTTTIPPPIPDEEYYDDYEDLPPKISSREETVSKTPNSQNNKSNRKPINIPIREDPRNRYETVRNPDLVEESRERPSSTSRYRPMMKDRPRFSIKNEESSEVDNHKSKSVQNDRYSLRNPVSSRLEDTRREKEAENQNSRETSRPRPLSLEEPDNSKAITDDDEDVEKQESEEEQIAPIKETKPTVRIVKRPFLPSRGGSPYLPRGLQPVGAAQKSLDAITTLRPTTVITTTTTTTTESTSIDMGSTISGVRLLEHGAPILRESLTDVDYPSYHKGPRTTQKPQIDPPRSVLDDIFDNEYDVTLNDALNPTLKPLTSNRGPPTGFSYVGKLDRDRYTFQGTHSQSLNNNDSLYSSTAVRSSAIQSPLHSSSSSSSSRSQSQSSSPYLSRGTGHTVYYDDYDY